MRNKDLWIIIISISFVLLELLFKTSNINAINQLYIVNYLGLFLLLSGDVKKGLILVLVGNFVIEALTYQWVGLSATLLFLVILVLIIIDKVTAYFADKSVLVIGSIMIIFFQILSGIVLSLFIPDFHISWIAIIMAVGIYAVIAYIFDNPSEHVYKKK